MNWLRFLLATFTIIVADLPWLAIISGAYFKAIKDIQGGRDVVARPLAGVIVYPALAYLALKCESALEAFLTGMAVYAVYDFTVLALFDKYPLYLAVADSLWGGVLFSIIYYIYGFQAH